MTARMHRSRHYRKKRNQKQRKGWNRIYRFCLELAIERAYQRATRGYRDYLRREMVRMSPYSRGYSQFQTIGLDLN
jgi:hypothetical protein